ncbi:MAG TPA: hypothetical protein VKB93_04865 [Thermoanaerobaculia bacterium]|nr:hypothetical protein [Thermoanaerobaculia bacterium]
MSHTIEVGFANGEQTITPPELQVDAEAGAAITITWTAIGCTFGQGAFGWLVGEDGSIPPDRRPTMVNDTTLQFSYRFPDEAVRWQYMIGIDVAGRGLVTGVGAIANS